MATSQLNVRIDSNLKKKGDEVLAREGMAGAQAIKALWEYLALEQRMPPNLTGRRRQGEADRSARFEPGLAVRLAAERGISLSADTVPTPTREERYEELLDQYEQRWKEGADA